MSCDSILYYFIRACFAKVLHGIYLLGCYIDDLV